MQRSWPINQPVRYEPLTLCLFSQSAQSVSLARLNFSATHAPALLFRFTKLKRI